MTPNPILKVLSVLNKYKVKYLLIGGQACIICRNVDTLIELAKRYRSLAKEVVKDRPLISSAIKGDKDELFIKLNKEEAGERKKDIAYWLPLKKELETLRHKIFSSKGVKTPAQKAPDP